MLNKRGQVTIFIIIGILIVAGVGLFFTFQDSIVGTSVPTTLEPVYNQFLECVKENTLTGINVMESQAGYIYLPEFEKGSEYMPFSSQLDFLGSAVPYWYYVSENGFEKEQVVSISDMETDLERFVEEQINDCDFDSYYEDEFLIDYGVVEAKANIKSEKVEIKLDMGMTIEKADESIFIKDHRVSVNSNLGKLYDSAIEVYEKEQDEFFLEEYAIDTLNLYAPVEGVEFTCSPQTWIVEEVFDELQQAIEDNTLSLKSKGGNYILNNKENEYFVVDVNSDVKFFNSVNWPYSFEVSPSDEAIMVTEPIGNQQGLGVLGFCYAPYHFVYNVKYPVLVQVQEGEEIFQFPLAVVIQGNKPREGLDVEIFSFSALQEANENVISSFAKAARRADKANFDLIEVHAGHGYLLHQFYSPISNTRKDEYGGNLHNRMRLALEVAEAIRDVLPEKKVLSFRISYTDWINGGWNLEDSITLSKELKKRGVDIIDVSSGGTSPNSVAIAKDLIEDRDKIKTESLIPLEPGYQVEGSASIKSKAKIRTAAVGLITNAKHAQDVIFYNKADFTFLARELLRDPYWPIRAAIELNQSHKLSVPGQYYLAWRDQEDFQFNGLNIQ